MNYQQHPQVQAAIHQAIINQLMPFTGKSATAMTFKHITANGAIHNALTAHGASTHPAWDSLGYPTPNKVDCIPLAHLPNGVEQLDSIHDLPPLLRAEAI